MVNRCLQRSWLAVLTVTMLGFGGRLIAAEIRISPLTVLLDSPEASQQVLVTEVLSKDRSNDLSRSVRYEITPPGIATVDDGGLVRPLSNGRCKLVIRHQKQRMTVPIEVRTSKRPRPRAFDRLLDCESLKESPKIVAGTLRVPSAFDEFTFGRRFNE